ncbi:Reverse transcriptase [Herbaspirillum sp. AP02]|uniref:reverse transcriptase domain-containing protein n=1 Tax=unclassified Herbaspirillum TaxID=2624150 RepID=UPI0015D96E3A|nr:MULTISPECIES: reverse transcriptase domain-containing protein [unclassified Herbaspirillum]MBG7620010.1 Reverse transcriptase [Herbaspirillum sp. AP02]NZD69262.1 Reverse transcriptase [Herbaspirillum sp. AP21]
MVVTLKQLAVAYRKAKVDLYYSSHASIEAIAAYEDDLSRNLNALLKKINSGDDAWIKKESFLGDWTLATKAISWPERKKVRDDFGTGLIFSDPREEWEYSKSLLEKKANSPTNPKAEFRVMAQCSLDFHVLSALWIIKVGQFLDAKLTKCAYGNRLRRTRDNKKLNTRAMGSFTPYLKPFRDWRDNGIGTMHRALEDNKKIVALTADVSSFYHELNPGFLLKKSFLKGVLGIELSPDQEKLHGLFIGALETWAKRTPLKKGLPVGLPASAVVANVALIELDRLMEQQIAPLYYGRYVDDILLVMENGASFQSTGDVWEWIFARSNGNLSWFGKKDDRKIKFSPKYLLGSGTRKSSNIHFSNSKNKVFILSGESGKDLINAIACQIQERASEWRAMPRLPQSAQQVGTDLLAATQSNGEAADNLRKTDVLTMRRAGFAIKLRDFEAYERDLVPSAWRDHRRAFFRAFTQHVLVLPHFFDLAIYLPRVIRLATACEDFKELRTIINSVQKITKEVADNCSIEIKAATPPYKIQREELITRWKKQLFSSVCESVAAAFPPMLTRAGASRWKKYMSEYTPEFDLDLLPAWPASKKEFQTRQARLFSFDLAHMPFRFMGLPAEMVSQRGVPKRGTIKNFTNASKLLPPDIYRGNSAIARTLGFSHLPHGLAFTTRPFSLAELFILDIDVFNRDVQSELADIVRAQRGFDLNEKMPVMSRNKILEIPDGKSEDKYRVAVSSWKTRIDSWVAAVRKVEDPDIERYGRLNHLLDHVISKPLGCRYLILPELALPSSWFFRIARKLHGRGISLIAGVEYLHAGKHKVRNQVWAALSHDGLGFPSTLIYRQDKQRPALHEELELQRLAGVKMKPDKKWDNPPIIQHGDFRFSLLICSELTNISYRAALRGNVDAIFVPEWNQDTESFNALVESAALDVHAYVIQCNDRQYGDSRIRAPYKNSWERDILRVKGGIADYCVMGEIDIKTLREFQSGYRSPPTPFKPVPDGFRIADERKILPT